MIANKRQACNMAKSQCLEHCKSQQHTSAQADAITPVEAHFISGADRTELMTAKKALQRQALTCRLMITASMLAIVHLTKLQRGLIFS